MTMHVVVVQPNLGEYDPNSYDADCSLLESCYARVAGDDFAVEVRRARKGEADGVYFVTANGNLQLTGYSVEMPEEWEAIKSQAWDLFVEQSAIPHRRP